jgi:hypothetical protein
VGPICRCVLLFIAESDRPLSLHEVPAPGRAVNINQPKARHQRTHGSLNWMP